ncbi:prolipoprotein diacylglyceryl transferase [Sporichthya sp.]|uniref:prolipoprotein diacylglyceryl transferase n=1 Tax=Sporichthya sp. TaxID=65475 RepID=UPI0017EEA9F9|nr:prolipoprotein diacylglyceryl transferase [Sporichthya sp.]MBA3744603.1 prolipoprotein diacylglyceryl transferase [Sporichthya sp.]
MSGPKEASILASIPSPSQGVWDLGPFPVRAYALCIIAGIIVAIVVGDRRLVARGGRTGMVADIAMWAVPMGVLGGRLYHVITTPEPYFGADGDPVSALYIWEGGLGIWGAVALGSVGAWIGTRQAGLAWPSVADAVIPGVALAQAIGRWGNWFNQELYGRPTDLPWALRIDPANRPDGTPDAATYHPTFLYESLWCLAVTALLIWADRRYRLGHGQVFALYVAAYCVGRFWIEALRVDEAEQILGMRLNNWTSILLGTVALAVLVYSRRKNPDREANPYRQGATPRMTPGELR